MIQKISNSMALRIGEALKLGKERRDIIAYGAFGLLQFIWSVILVAIPAVLLNVLREAMVMSFAAAIFRKSSGGVHATSPGRCAVIGAVVFNGMSFAVKAVHTEFRAIYYIIYLVFCLLLSYIVICRYSPVDTPNKPITNHEMKKKLRRASFITMHVYVIIILVLTVLLLYTDSFVLSSILLSLSTGILLQAFTLTMSGHHVITYIDLFMKKIKVFGKAGGEKA